MLAPWIISHFPAHRVYTEAFGGAASVMMRKPRASLVEVYNDLDGEICNLFRILRDPVLADVLKQQIALTPWARDEFKLSYRSTDDAIEQARRTVIRAFMGFGSDSASGAQTGFRSNGNRQFAHPAKDWTNYPPALAAFTDRLRGVVVENRPALEIIRQHDDPSALHYVDPPYPWESRQKSTCRTGKGYRHEMTTLDHQELADVLHGATGMVVLSGYGCDLYDAELYPDWKRITRDTRADGGLERTEVLWLNLKCEQALGGQQSLIGIPA